MATRTRLTPVERETQLLDLGATLFATSPYEDVHIETVAELAGVSRGLLYHYFPNKRAFFAALVRRGSERMMAATQPDLGLPLIDQLYASIDAYLVHCEQHRHGIRAVFNGAASGDPEVQAIIAEGNATQEQRILDVLEPERPAPELLRIAVRSWLLFLRSACHEWLTQLDADEVSREEIRDLCANTFVATVLALPEHARPTGIAALIESGDSYRTT